MKNIKHLSISLMALILPLSASAAVYDVTFSGAAYEYTDANFDYFQADSDYNYFDIYVDGQFRIDTGVLESPLSPANWANALSSLFVEVADYGGGSGLYDSLTLTTVVDDGAIGLMGNNVFVSSASSDNSADLYLQSFFVGNMNLILQSSGPDLDNDIAVFDSAAAGNAGDYFLLSGFFGDGSNGSFQTDSGEYYFDIDSVSITPVPVPAAVWFFASGLMGLAAAARRKN